MQRRSLLTFLATLIALPSFAAARGVTRVIVRNKAFRVVKEISSAAEVAKFTEHWTAGSTTADRTSQFDYKIDVYYESRSERWLYSADGYARALSKRKTPTYQFDAPGPFNQLLGIPS